MIEKIDKKLCSGCNACANVCPKNAIKMEEDREGFWYPKVDYSLCIKCCLCIETCPSIRRYVSKNVSDELNVYAGWSKNEDTRLTSTSGGIFSELANEFLKKGGFVGGAKYGDNFQVEHALISNVQEINTLKQSKYVQSQIGYQYKSIRELLLQDKKVLFCGTPCQNAGLSCFLGREYKNLIKVDFICRGVISPLVYSKYLRMLEEKNGGKITNFSFKNKTHGWNEFSTLAEFNNGARYLKNRYEDIYMIGYLKHNLYLRPSCHHCLYKEMPRITDITLGDFWGIANSKPNLDDNKGTSVIMLNSEKGHQMFDGIKEHLFYEKCSYEEVVSGNPCLIKSVLEGENRTRFFEYIQTESFENAFNYAINKD